MRKKTDKVLLIAVLIISLFGLIMVYSSSMIWAEYKFHDPFKYVKNQAIFFLLGCFFMMGMQKINFKFLYQKASLFLLIAVILLILVLIPGIGTVRNGSRSWFGIGPFGIQPSEFAKLALMVFIAKYFTQKEKEMTSFWKGPFKILLVTGFLFLLIMLQPDFGTGFILVMSAIGLLFVGGLDFKFFIKAGIVGVGAVAILIVLAPYRLKRILSFLDPWSDPLGSGFQMIQSLYAIGPGGLFGQGFLKSRQKHFYLPEPQTDFIFAIIAEEFGFLGVMIVTTLFLTIIYRGFKIAKASDDLFQKYLAFGITFALAFQTILNLMVVVGLIPVTGVTLPFLSYGGSSLLITFLQMGLLLNISKNT